jgi:transposase-like protein
MKPSDIKPPPVKKRGRYTKDFKRQSIEACAAPGVSTASLARANGINANLLRRWVADRRNNTEIGGVSVKAEPEQPEFFALIPKFENIIAQRHDSISIWSAVCFGFQCRALSLNVRNLYARLVNDSSRLGLGGYRT